MQILPPHDVSTLPLQSIQTSEVGSSSYHGNKDTKTTMWLQNSGLCQTLVYAVSRPIFFPSPLRRLIKEARLVYCKEGQCGGTVPFCSAHDSLSSRVEHAISRRDSLEILSEST